MTLFERERFNARAAVSRFSPESAVLEVSLRLPESEPILRVVEVPPREADLMALSLRAMPNGDRHGLFGLPMAWWGCQYLGNDEFVKVFEPSVSDEQ